LVSRRRLGQTQLTLKMVAGTTNSTNVDPTTLPAFDYAHLRAPLPKGIVSGIFKSSPNSYFLMRRSYDGFVSATGMFKAAFPYAEAEDEEQERKYIKSLETTSPEETAGNIWISPEQALSLAEEYGILAWIRALLDPADIQSSGGSEGTPQKKISAPPKFFYGAPPAMAPPTPTSLPRSSRSRRSASPTKSSAAKRSTAGRKRPTATVSSSSQQSVADTASSSGSPGLPNGDATASVPLLTPAPTALVESVVKEPAVVLAPVEEEPKVKITVDQDVKVDEDGTETTRTNVEVELPLAGELPSADEAAKMVAEAKEMVKAAAETVAASAPSASKKGKRKADALGDDEDKENAEEGSAPTAKRAKTEVELKKERVRRRALLGISATLAVG